MKRWSNGERTDASDLERTWKNDPRWRGIARPYSAEDVLRLRGSVPVEHTLARRGAEHLWGLLHGNDHVSALGVLTGIQAVQTVRAGLKAVYVSGGQVAADNNLSEQMYPDQSLYPSNSMPALVRRINNALRRADQVACLDGGPDRDWMAPLVADAEAGFGGPLHCFELTKALIEAGASGIHLEDQLASHKKGGHMDGKVLVPTGHHIRNLVAARLAADVLDVPTLLIARTDAHNAVLLSDDSDPSDGPFLLGERTREGLHRVRAGMEPTIARGLRYAPYADLLWFEASRPDLEEARRFAHAIHQRFPGKVLAYNLSPSFNWKAHPAGSNIQEFQAGLGRLGYRFQFVTLAGFHALAASMFELAEAYARQGMPAYVDLQQREFALASRGYTAARHQREVGTGYFDEVAAVITGASSPTLAFDASTEEEQFLKALLRAAPSGNGAAKPSSITSGRHFLARSSDA